MDIIHSTDKRMQEYQKEQDKDNPYINNNSTKSALPSNMFSIIEGYNDIKDLFTQSLHVNNPVHLLLVGPPASSKSLFLEEINRLPRSMFILGGTSSKAGIADLVFSYKPKYLIIDELDKINRSKDLSALLTIMESGKLVEAKYKRYNVVNTRMWVFSAANRTNKIPPELLSRFWVLYLSTYTDEELERVIIKVLTEREGKSMSLSKYIADKVINELRSKDPRDGIKIARLSTNKESVDRCVTVMKKYNKNSISKLIND